MYVKNQLQLVTTSSVASYHLPEIWAKDWTGLDFKTLPDIELPVPGQNISCISDTNVRESTKMLTVKLPNSNAFDVGTPYEETLQE